MNREPKSHRDSGDDQLMARPDQADNDCEPKDRPKGANGRTTQDKWTRKTYKRDKLEK